uniref:Death domain-containing protein n=1 Tax=Branchiostoma floridae TaxID=7739 RepID=C3XSQ8_BRAFL|eukprot:XP_002612970.1 hypothetical protein BRAFLDRAFT_74755 [Branchiostoma floridae]
MMLAEATPGGSHLNLQKRREVLQENQRFAQQIRGLELTYGKIAAQQKSLISALENGMSSFKTTPINTQKVENLQDVRKSYDVLLTRDIGAVQQRKSHHTEVLETLLNAVEDLKVLRDSTKADLVEPIFYTEMSNAERERTADLLARWKTLLKDENDLTVLHHEYPKTPFKGITSDRPWYSLDPRDAARFGGILSLIPVTLDIAKKTHRVVQTVASGEKSMLQKDSLKLPSVLSDLVKFHPDSSEAEPTRIHTQQRRKWEKPNVFGEERPEVTYRRAASAVSDVQDNEVAAPKRKQWSKDPLSMSTPGFLSNNPHNPGHVGQKLNPGVHNGKGNPGTPISNMARGQRQGMQGVSGEEIRVIVKDMIAPLSVQVKANSDKLQDVEGQVRQCSARLTTLSEHQAGLALKVFEAIRKDLEEHLNTNIRDIIKTEMETLTPRSTEEIRKQMEESMKQKLDSFYRVEVQRLASQLHQDTLRTQKEVEGLKQSQRDTDLRVTEEKYGPLQRQLDQLREQNTAELRRLEALVVEERNRLEQRLKREEEKIEHRFATGAGIHEESHQDRTAQSELFKYVQQELGRLQLKVRHLEDAVVQQRADTGPKGTLRGDQLLWIARQVGNKYWNLGIKLGLSLGALGEIKHANPGDVDQMAFAMLLDWQRQYGDGATVDRIVDSLHQLHLTKLADSVRDSLPP